MTLYETTLIILALGIWAGVLRMAYRLITGRIGRRRTSSIGQRAIAEEGRAHLARYDVSYTHYNRRVRQHRRYYP